MRDCALLRSALFLCHNPCLRSFPIRGTLQKSYLLLPIISYIAESKELHPISVNIFKKLLKEIRRRNPYDYKYQYVKKGRLKSLKILTDDVEFNTTKPDKEFDFRDYSNTVAKIVNGSYENVSIGIYGEWGTGKTTLMKLIEMNLKPCVFRWNDVPGNDTNKLKKFLKENFDGVEWIDMSNLEFSKSNDEKQLLITPPNGYNSVSITLESGKAILEVNNEKIYDFFVEKDLDNTTIRENNILTVWFNAWRYEREEQFALVPLMKTIAYAMGEHPIYKNIKPILIKGLEILSKDILRNLATRYIMTETGFKEFEEKLVSKLESLPEIDKDTIYFDGIKKIEQKIDDILSNYPNSRIVVFIDDLDRCSPETALEVFESIKVFLQIKGFVFIIGLSREALDKLIKAKFEKMGLKDISGEQYIRKIIQIEVNIQKWKDYAIKELINTLSLRVDPVYHDNIINNRDLILKAVEHNPRQTKGFINNFIVALSANSSLKPKEFLVTEVLIKRWPSFYQDMNSNIQFRELVKEYAHMTQDTRTEHLNGKQRDKEKQTQELKQVLEIDPELWDFLQSNQDSLSKVIEDWDIYRSAGESTRIPYDKLQSIEAVVRNATNKYNQVVQGKMDITEFWSKGTEGNLLGAVMTLQDNMDSLKLSDYDKELISRLLSVIPTRLREYDDSRAMALEGRARETAVGIMRLYADAIRMLDRLIEERFTTRPTTIYTTK